MRAVTRSTKRVRQATQLAAVLVSVVALTYAWPAAANTAETGSPVSTGIVSSGCTVTGTARGEVIRGTDGDDVICAGGGNDIVYAGGGNDVLRGEAGNDTLHGEGGDDALAGGAGTDTVIGGDGVNVCAPEVNARQCMLDGTAPRLSAVTATYDGTAVTASWQASDSTVVSVTAQVGTCPAVTGALSTASCPASVGARVLVRVQASDTVGNTATGTLTYTVPRPVQDTRAPQVVAFPTLSGARVGVAHTLRWTVQDTSPVTATNLTAVVGTVTATSGPAELVSTQGERTAWQQHLNFTTPGRYAVSITATDVHGNTATRLVGYITAR